MSEQTAHHEDGHHDDPMSHVPPPSFWPFGVGVSLVLFGVGATLALPSNEGGSGGLPILFLGIFGILFCLMGWCHQVIKEKPIAHDLAQQQVDLKFFVKGFLISELMAFAAVFAYFYLRKFVVDPEAFAEPPGLHLGGAKVAFATFLLLSSSVTCELAHHAVMHKQWTKARLLMLSTLALGVIFLGFQGMEYGELIQWGFWPPAMFEDGSPHTAFMATFFIATGFHGFHVLTGLAMLFLVYVRMEMGHFNEQRHFSMVAASWYWHFVDIVWILLFITVYVV